VLANRSRYDESVLNNHVARLHSLLSQFAANPTLRCGEAH
jgi:enterobactin synthetase component F